MKTTHEFLGKHPTPWRYEETECDQEGFGVPGRGRIVDANGQSIIESGDPDGYESWIVGDTDELIAFVNSLGNSTNP